jgi:hypothetical protein
VWRDVAHGPMLWCWWGCDALAVMAVQASQLMLGADGNLWVVKFQNNPQHLRVLANELIVTRIAEAVGLTVPKSDVIEVSEWLVGNSPEMWVDQVRGAKARCAHGLQFGSQFVGGMMPGQVVDYLPESQMAEVRNLAEFAGMLVVDKWTGNCNGRQAVFERKARERRYRAIFIDQGFCFNAGGWDFPDAPLRGVFPRNHVYATVRGWQSFEPWLSRVENFAASKLGEIAEEVPPAWYGGDTRVLEQMMETLLQRRSRVRELVGQFRDSSRRPFPEWGKTALRPVPGHADWLGEAGKMVM